MTPRHVVAIGTLTTLLTPSFALAQTSEGLGRSTESRQEVEATKLSKIPKQTKFVKAVYPKAAEEQNITAEVVLMLDISAEGRVDSATVSVPATPSGMGFDEAATVAALEFEFEPAELNGKPVAVQIAYKYKFTLEPKAPVKEPQAVDAPGAPGPIQVAAPVAPATPEVPATPKVVNLRGVLLERGTRLPMPGVTVTVFRGEGADAIGFEATSDSSGQFEFFDLAPGEWKVLVESPGYYPYRTSETLAKGEALKATYYVEKGTYNPYDVTVTVTRPKKEVSRTVVTVEEAQRVPGGMGDPMAVIQNLAGVARTESAATLVIRGSDPNDSRTLLESTEIPMMYHFGGLRTVVPAGMLESIEFYPGNFSSEYGRATGGIVDVRLKKLEPKKFGGYLDVSLLDANLYLEAPIGDKAAVAVAGRRSYIDYVIEAAVPDDAPVELVAPPRYYDYQILGRYRPTPKHDIRSFFFFSDDRFELLFDNPADIDSELTDNDFSWSTSFYRGIITDHYVPNQRFSNQLKLSIGKDWMNMDFAQFFMDMDFLTVDLKDKAHYEFDRHFAVNAGFDVNMTRANVLLKIPHIGSEGAEEDEDFARPDSVDLQGEVAWYPAFFAEAELTPGKGLLFIPGLRVDRFALIDRWSVQPRLTGRWEFLKDTVVKGGIGLYTQESYFLEVNEGFGNPDLEPERAMHYSVGLEHRFPKGLSVDGTLFYKRLTRQTSPTDRLIERNGELVPMNYDNGGEGKVRGLELMIRQDLRSGFSGWIAYTLSRSTRRDSGETEERLFDWDQTHILNVVAGYALPRNWMLSSRFRFSTGQPMTPIIGSTYDASSDEYRPVYGKVNSDREGTFHQLDARIEKRWIYDAWTLTAYLDVQNVYNHRSHDGLKYNYDFSKSKTQSGLPLYPIIGLKGEF